jgi:hypothetical protein
MMRISGISSWTSAGNEAWIVGTDPLVGAPRAKNALFGACGSDGTKPSLTNGDHDEKDEEERDLSA